MYPDCIGRPKEASSPDCEPDVRAPTGVSGDQRPLCTYLARIDAKGRAIYVNMASPCIREVIVDHGVQDAAPAAQPRLTPRAAEALRRVLASGQGEAIDTTAAGKFQSRASCIELLPETGAGGRILGVVMVWRACAPNPAENTQLRQYSQRLQSMAQRLVRVQETERSRIASELHDMVGQNLTAIGIKLDILGGMFPAVPPEAIGTQIALLKALLRSTVEFTRGVLSELRPPELDVLGIAEGLRGVVRDAGEKMGFDARLSVCGLESRLEANIELTLYRIAQEAITNAARHSGTMSADIRLQFEPDRVRLEIIDRGRGFLPAIERRAAVRGIGLTIMRERVDATGGEMVIDSAMGSGTRICVTIPTRTR